MKFNWGTGIATIYGAFALIMLAFVARSRQYDPGLVSDDYYKLDLNYQAHLDKKRNAAGLTEGLQVQYDAVAQVIRLQFPTALGKPQGSVKCFRPASTHDDMLLEIQAGPDGRFEIPASRLTNGLWGLEIDWQAGETKYFNEARVTITHA